MHKQRWLFGVLALVAILGVTIFVLKMITDRRRESAVEQLKAKAELIAPRLLATKATITQMEGEDIPSHASVKIEEDAEDTIAAFDRLVETWKALDSDTQQQEKIGIMFHKRFFEWTEQDHRLVAEFFEANPELIHEIRRLADAKTPLYQLDYSLGNSMSFQSLYAFRHLARLLGVDAALANARGDYEEMGKSLLAIIRLAAKAAEEPTTTNYMISNGVISAMNRHVEESIRGENLSPDLLKKIVKELSHLEGRERLSNALAVEGLLGLETFEGIRTGDFNRLGLPVEGMVDVIILRVWGSVFARPILNQVESTYADYVVRLSDVIELPFYEAKPLIDQIDAEIAQLAGTQLLTRFLLAGLTRLPESQAWHEATMGLMQVGLAIEQYYGQHGEYPRNLDEIAPVFDGRVPLDPFTGRPFVYQPQNDNYSLYSPIGSVIDISDRLRWGWIDEQGNIVWRGLTQE